MTDEEIEELLKSFRDPKYTEGSMKILFLTPEQEKLFTELLKQENKGWIKKKQKIVTFV